MKEWIEQLKERLKKLNERMESFTNSENGRRLRITGDVLWNLGLIFIILFVITYLIFDVCRLCFLNIDEYFLNLFHQSFF